MAELCDLCGVRPATVRARVTRNGETEVLNLCEVDYRRLAARQRSASPLKSPDGRERIGINSARGTVLRDDPGWRKRSSNARMPPSEGERALAQAAVTTHIRIVDQVDLVVHAVDCGWLVDCPILGQPLAFFSGGKAEAMAHELGRVVAAAGYDVRVEVQDRMRKVIGATRYSAGPSASRLVSGIRAAGAPARVP